MKIGIMLLTYNRKDYLVQTLECLRKTIYPVDTDIVIVDDHSDDDTFKEIYNFWLDEEMFGSLNVYVIEKTETLGVSDSMQKGLAFLKENDCDIFVKLDSDMLLKQEWLVKMLDLLTLFPEKIITGFNANNTKRHKTIREHDEYYEKRTIAGALWMFNHYNYDLVMSELTGKNWDWRIVKHKIDKGESFVCCKPGVAQHIGMQSSDTLQHIQLDQDTEFKL